MWLNRPLTKRPTQPPRFRPGLEALEARDVPATFYPANAAELVAAVATANGTNEADTIVLNAGATYTLTENYYRESWEPVSIKPLNPGVGPTGLPVVAAAGRPLMVVGNGAVIERSVVAGTPAFRLVAVESGASLTTEHLTLQNGQTENTHAPAGGAVYNRGTAVLWNVTVQNSRSQSGGGIFSDGALTITGGAIRGNQAIGVDGRPGAQGGGEAFGGGVHVGGGTAILTGVTLAGNTAQGGRGGDGYSYTTSRGTTYKIPAGDGGDGLGGGLFAAGGTTVLAGCTVTGNQAVGGAGGNSGYKGGGAGKNGQGLGGGIYVDVGVAIDWDAITSITNNTASGRAKNVYRA